MCVCVRTREGSVRETQVRRWMCSFWDGILVVLVTAVIMIVIIIVVKRILIFRVTDICLLLTDPFKDKKVS
jgi:hypothetical protein